MICFHCKKESIKLNKNNICNSCNKSIKKSQKLLDSEFIEDFDLYYCKQCNVSKNKSYFYKNNLNLCKDCLKQINIEYRIKNFKSYLLNLAKSRAKKKNIEFSISEDDFYIPNYCPVLKIKLELIGTDIDYRPTIDRIDNSKGYIPENIQIISFRANRIKNDSNKKELEQILNS